LEIRFILYAYEGVEMNIERMDEIIKERDTDGSGEWSK